MFCACTLHTYVRLIVDWIIGELLETNMVRRLLAHGRLIGIIRYYSFAFSNKHLPLKLCADVTVVIAARQSLDSELWQRPLVRVIQS